MPSKQNQNAGLQSSAGLVRYFDSEDSTAPRLDPRTVLAFATVFGTVVFTATQFLV